MISPASQRLARILNQMFQLQARDAARRITFDDVEAGRAPDMSGWVASMAEAAKPILLEETQRGMLGAAHRIATKLGFAPPMIASIRQQQTEGVRQFAAAGAFKRYNGAGAGRKSPSGSFQGALQELAVRATRSPSVSYQPLSYIDRQAYKVLMKGVMLHGRRQAEGSSSLLSLQKRNPQLASLSYSQVTKAAAPMSLDFDLFQPRVLDAVDAAAFKFCRETMETATVDFRAAIEALRELLRRGLPRGDAIAYLARKVREIFTDPYRAFRIAATETSRAMNTGSLMASKDSGLKLLKEWVASSDACDFCLELANHKPIPLDKPFHVDPKGGPYAVIMAPPGHPFLLLHGQ